MRFLAIMVTMAAVLSGCTASSIGRSLGGVSYVVDKKADRQAISWIWTENDLSELAELVAQLGDTDLQQRLAEVDLTSDVVVSLYFDACSTQDPELTLEGSVLTVRYRTDLNRNCARAVDTLALFAVPRADLPDAVVYFDHEFRLT